MLRIKTYALPAILLLFVALSTWGIFYNYPLTDAIGDETVLMAASLKMLGEQTLRPDFPTNYHLPVGAYLYLPFFAALLFFLRFSGAFPSIDSLIEFGILDYGRLLPMARFVSVILGALSIYLVYKICRKLFADDAVALAASFLVATDAFFVFLSHFGKVWIPQMFTILLAFYAIVCLYQARSPRLAGYSGVGALIAAAFGTHVVGAIVYLPLLVAHYYKHSEKKFIDIFITDTRLLACHATILSGIALTYWLNPYGLQNYFGQSTAAAGGLVAPAHVERNFIQGFFFYAQVLWEYAPLVLALCIPGAVALYRTARQPFFILLSFIAGYYVAIGPFLGTTHAIPHYISPALPFLAIVAAFGAVSLYRSFLARLPRIARFSSLALGMLACLILPALFGYRLMGQTTQQQFMRWFPSHIPSGSSVVNFNALLPITEDRASIELVQRLNPGFLLRRQQYLLTVPPERYPSPKYFVVQPSLFARGLPAEIDTTQFSYAVLSWSDAQTYADVFADAQAFGVTEDKLIALFPPSATKDAPSVDLENIRRPLRSLLTVGQAGPIIAVYKLH